MGLFVLICVIDVDRTVYTIFCQLQSLVVIFTHADRQSVDISVNVCLFVILSFCMLTDFSSGIKFCTMVHGRPGMESPILGNFAPPEAQNPTNRRAAASILPIDASPLLTSPSRQWRGNCMFNCRSAFS